MSNNTAHRWWVRTLARWLARIDGVSKHLRLGFLAMTGISTTLIGLKDYGYGEYAWPVIITAAITGFLYAYLYAEGGVWNQVQRDRQDMAANFSDPPQLIDNVQIAAAVFAAHHGRPPTDDELTMLETAVREPWTDYRNGINVEDHP